MNVAFKSVSCVGKVTSLYTIYLDSVCYVNVTIWIINIRIVCTVYIVFILTPALTCHFCTIIVQMVLFNKQLVAFVHYFELINEFLSDITV